MIITRNDEARGHWLVLDRRVYDLTAFLAMHPGGVQVLRGYAGMDATQGYLRAHRGATDVDAVREMYAVGKVRALDFRGAARPVERTGAATHLTEVAALYRAWVNVTYLAVEMQNALRNNLGLQRAVTARGEAPAPRSPYKLERLLETQERFLGSYANGLIGAPAIALWELAEGLWQGHASSFMRDALGAIQTGPSAHHAAALTVRLRAELAAAIADHAVEAAPIAANIPKRSRGSASPGQRSKPSPRTSWPRPRPCCARGSSCSSATRAPSSTWPGLACSLCSGGYPTCSAATWPRSGRWARRSGSRPRGPPRPRPSPPSPSRRSWPTTATG